MNFRLGLAVMAAVGLFALPATAAEKPQEWEIINPVSYTHLTISAFPKNFFSLESMSSWSVSSADAPSSLFIIPKEYGSNCFSDVQEPVDRRSNSYSLFLYTSFY